MPNAPIIAALIVVGYLLGTTLTPAAADDSGKIIDALQALVRSEKEQAESLRRIAENSAKCAR